MVHESVHALDFKNGWYFKDPLSKLTPDRMEKIEALGWTAQHMISALKSFKSLEDKLKNPNTTPDQLNTAWYAVVQATNSLFSDDIVWQSTSVTGGTRNVGKADIQDMSAKPGLDFAMAALMARYQQAANRLGITYTFSLTNVSMLRSNVISVPTTFRH